MYHRRTAAAWRDASSTAGLGEDPPLGVDGDEEEVDRRRVSARWFAATLLTALCGSLLMGGAVYAALNSEHRLALMPEKARKNIGNTLAQGERPTNVDRKGDRMSLLGDMSVARQTFRVSTATKVGDREIIKVRPFTRVSANLAMTTTSVSSDIPEFNPMKIAREAMNEEEDEAPEAEPTGEVTVVMKDLSDLSGQAKLGSGVPMEQVLVKVREVADLSRTTPMLAGLPEAIVGKTPHFAADSPYLAYAVEGLLNDREKANTIAPAPAAPTNVSFISKTSVETSGGNDWADTTVVVKKGDSIVSILTKAGVSEDDARALARTFGRWGREGKVVDGWRLRMLLQQEGERILPLRVSLFSDTGHMGSVALSDRNDFVNVPELAETEMAGVSEDTDNSRGPGIRLYDSIYETALRNEVPREIIADIIRVYSFDVDFQRRVRPGDNFEILYSEDPAGNGEVLYAALTLDDSTNRYYRFRTPDDGLTDYYDQDGKSAKQFLMRKPVASGTMRSGFGYRRHPILGYSKLHTGVDWAARTGTPIYAAGNGTVRYARWKSGYGKHTEIQHANGYVTTYSHQSGFARGVREGAKVRQGQVIGYIGSTGLSTGPHLHYEVKINGNFVDPLRIRLPRGKALRGKMLSSFQKERERIDTLMNHGQAPAHVADASRTRKN
ncbi:peptidoglycan DD-metalloendopeptidase family protein [Xanthobacter sp. TB0139]|uniref:peptidoglycan DD-metalloendopeptidase family protein n=1 Tax=Xanthobacter sp. TB0139 TaxID=3459178 RepID=UPI0040396A2E